MNTLSSLFASLNPYVIGGLSVLLLLFAAYLAYESNVKKKDIENKKRLRIKYNLNLSVNNPRKNLKMPASFSRLNSSLNFQPQSIMFTENHIKEDLVPVELSSINNIFIDDEIDEIEKIEETDESSDPLYYIDIAKLLDRKGNRTGTLQAMKKAAFFQMDKSEKLKYESILRKYEDDPFCSLRDLLINKDNEYYPENIPEASFTYLSQKKRLPRFKTLMSEPPPITPTMTSNHLNKITPRFDDFQDLNNLEVPLLSGLNKHAMASNINEISFTSPEQLVKAINSGNVDSTHYDTKENNMSHTQQFSPDNLPESQFAYDIWVHWMSTANGRSSFKNNIIHLENPWTSKNAILELSEILNNECRNSDGSPAAWSILSINPFFDF